MTTSQNSPAKSTTRRREIALAIVGLAAMGIVQPLFDLLGRNAGFLTAHGLEGSAFFGFVAALGLGLPAALAGSYLLLERRRSGSWLGEIYAALVVFTLATGFSALLLRRLSDSSALLVTGALTLGALLAWLVLAHTRVRQFAGLLAAFVIVFPLIFLMGGGVAELRTKRVTGFEYLESELERQPILFVLFDELPISTLMRPDETLDDVRFPSFAAVADTATWYRRAVSAAESTMASVPSIVTGRLPLEHAEPVVSSYPENLFTWLWASGYELFVEQSFTRLCPEQMCREVVPRPPLSKRLEGLTSDLGVLYAHLVAPPAWAARLPAVDQTWSGFWRARGQPQQLGTSVPLVVESYLRAIEARPRERLYYLHLNLPHVPWKFLPTGREYGPLGQSVRPHGIRGEVWGDDEWETVQGLQQHLLQSQYADRVLGQLMARFQELGLWDEALVVVTADHGVSFWPGQSRRQASTHNLEDVLEVPLFVKLPRQRQGVIDDRPVQTLDILPTIAEVLGGTVPWPIAGRSLLGDIPGNRIRRYATGAPNARRSVEIEIDETRRARTLDRKRVLFGIGSQSLYDIGEYPELLGRPFTSFEAGSSRLRYTLLDPFLLEAVDPKAEFVPVRVYGSLDGVSAPAPGSAGFDNGSHLPWLAVSFDGVVRAVTRAFVDQQERVWFAALVDETILRPGKNRVEVHQIEQLGDGPPRLLRLGAETPTRVTLLRVGAQVRGLEISDRGSIALVPGAVMGSMTLLNDRIGGWAATSGEPSRPYEELFLFRGDRLLYRGVAERRTAGGHAVEGAGFRLELSRSSARESEELRLFARVGELLSEIPPVGDRRRRGTLQPATAERDDAGKLRLRTKEGDVIPVAGRVVLGNVSVVEVRDEHLRLEGWAAQASSRLPVLGLVALVNGRGVAGSYKVEELEVIAEEHGDTDVAVESYGFRLDIEMEQLPQADELFVRLFGLTSDGRAGELQVDGKRLAPAVRQAIEKSRSKASSRGAMR